VNELVTTGIWTVKDGQSAEFTRARSGFAEWASGMDGATTLRLCRDAAEPARFLSFGPGRDLEAAHAWKATAQFRERIGRVLEHVARFEPAELDSVVTVSAATVGDG